MKGRIAVRGTANVKPQQCPVPSAYPNRNPSPSYNPVHRSMRWRKGMVQRAPKMLYKTAEEVCAPRAGGGTQGSRGEEVCAPRAGGGTQGSRGRVLAHGHKLSLPDPNPNSNPEGLIFESQN